MSFFGWIGTACLLYLRIWSVLPAAALGALVMPLPWLYVLRRRARRFRRFEEQLPEAIDMLVQRLESGAQPHDGDRFYRAGIQRAPERGIPHMLRGAELWRGLAHGPAESGEPDAGAGPANLHRGGADSEGKRRQSGRGPGKGGADLAGAVPPAQTNPGAYGPGADDGMDPGVVAGGAGIRDVHGAPGRHQHSVDQPDRTEVAVHRRRS